jgi:L-threonylcarbamoyladenylate synthase
MSATIRTADDAAIKEAITLIKAGEVIAFPTETVYGLAADATNDAAIKKIFALKQRDESVPLQVMVSGLDVAHQIATFSQEANILARDFWPGPLTLVLPRREDARVSAVPSAGKDTIGLRIPMHTVSLELLQQLGMPIATTSANLSGGEDAVNAAQVAEVFGGGVALILDAGEAEHGKASSVVDTSGEELLLLREGVLSKAVLESVLSPNALKIP